MLTPVITYYLTFTAIYLAFSAYSKKAASYKLRSRSELAIWNRDFFYKLNWIVLPLILLPAIAMPFYFLYFDQLSTGEIFMYLMLFVLFCYLAVKGCFNLFAIIKQFKLLPGKPGYTKKISSEDTAKDF